MRSNSALAITGAPELYHLSEIDQRVSEALASLSDIAASVEMPLACALTDEAEIERHNYAVIYRIDIQTPGAAADFHEWINELRSVWELEKRFTPSLKKKRISGHTSLLDWMPFYLGKSKNVAKRVIEHIHLPLDKTTYALKLKARPGIGSRAFRLTL